MYRKAFAEKLVFNEGIIENAIAENPFVSVGDVVFKALEEAILTSRIPAGSRLNITKLSEALNVSPTPVRSAIDKLASENLVKIVTANNGQHKSYTVFDISPKEMGDVFIARKSIEGMAAYICAEHPWIVDLDRMRMLADEFYETMKYHASRDIAQRAISSDNNTDRQFHQMMVEATGNEYLMAAYKAIEKRVLYLSIRTASLNARESKDTLIQMGSQHVSIFNAIQDGYPEMARNLMETHIDHCMNCCLRNHKISG